MTQLKVAIIGAGSMGREHARAFQAQDGVEICGIVSRTKSRAQALAKELDITHVYDTIDELYEKTQADLVIVAVPELQANQVAKQCFRHSWKVLMEKPAGYDLADSNDILQAANKAGVSVAVAFNRRFYSSVQSVKNGLSEINGKRYIHIQDQQSYEEARYHKHPEAVVEKFMFANSIHNIDLILALARGKIISIKPIKPWFGEKTEVMLSYIEFDSGDSALYEGVWQGPGPWACRVSTKEKCWFMQPLETAMVQNNGERTKQSIDIDPIDTDFKAGFYRQAAEVVNWVKGEENSVISLQESMRTMQLIHNMFFATEDMLEHA